MPFRKALTHPVSLKRKKGKLGIEKWQAVGTNEGLKSQADLGSPPAPPLTS